jgi:hypothetical protein
VAVAETSWAANWVVADMRGGNMHGHKLGGRGGNVMGNKLGGR